MNKKEINQLKERLEDYFTEIDGNEIYKEFNVDIEKIKDYDTDCGEGIIDFYKLTFSNTEDGSTYCYRTKSISNDLEQMILEFIGSVYVEDINNRKSIVNNWNAFTSRKVKSLSYWMEKNRTEKVNQLNIDLVEQYKIVEKYKCEIAEYKRFICALYAAKKDILAKVA